MSDLISREEVLNLIDTAFENGAFDGRYAYENLIDAVQNLIHPLETDCISRQAVLREFTCLSDDAFVINRKIQEIVKKLPSVEPERKPGKWIHVGDGGYCSECGHDMPWFFVNWNYVPQETPFCPNCDAKMEVDG